MAQESEGITLRSLRGVTMEATVTIPVRVTCWLRVRLAVARLLLRAGAWVAGCELEVEQDCLYGQDQ